MKLSKKSIVAEKSRSYSWRDPVTKEWVRVTIEQPVYLWFQSVGSTHRVQDIFGHVYVVPSPGNFGCFIRYVPRNINEAVDF